MLQIISGCHYYFLAAILSLSGGCHFSRCLYCLGVTNLVGLLQMCEDLIEGDTCCLSCLGHLQQVLGVLLLQLNLLLLKSLGIGVTTLESSI